MIDKREFVNKLMKAGKFVDLQYLMLGVDPEQLGLEFDTKEIGDENWNGACHYLSCCIEANKVLKEEFAPLFGKKEWLTNYSQFKSWVENGCNGLCEKGIGSYLRYAKNS